MITQIWSCIHIVLVSILLYVFTSMCFSFIVLLPFHTFLSCFQPLFPYKDWDPDIAPCAQPNLDYLAPEYALTESCGLASDMFSVGVLIYAVFNNGKPLYECKSQLSAFKKNAEEVKRIILHCPVFYWYFSQNSSHVCRTNQFLQLFRQCG